MTANRSPFNAGAQVSPSATTAGSSLARADRAALAQSDEAEVSQTVAPCPNRAADQRQVVEVAMLGEDGVGLPAIALLLTGTDGRILSSRTGRSGMHRFLGLLPGSYQLSLPELDQEAWLLLKTDVLPAPEAHSDTTAAWRPGALPEKSAGQVHVVKQGDCIGSIAERYGFSPQTILDVGANKALIVSRHENMHALFEDDVVAIPAKQPKAIDVVTGTRVTLQRQGVPEFLRIRFLYHDESPKAGVPYLLCLVTAKGMQVPDIPGTTDADGFVVQPIPPTATRATIVLHPGPWAEIHECNLGYKDPIDEVSGWQSRLNSLGYDCGPEDNRLGSQTRAAICAFQRAKNLEETGVTDDATKAALLKLALS